jgi:geranylgeranyl reductase family protein
MRDKYDVVVVGAGPAGSYSALKCASRGLKTLLLDRQSFPRDKPCGGILEAKYFVKLAPFLVGLEENITYHTSLHYDFNKMYVRPLKSYIYKRRNFDAALVDYAKAHGVEFHDNARVTGLHQTREHVTINWEQKSNSISSGSTGVKVKSHSKLCIGADGVNSLIRRCSGLDKYIPKHNKINAILIEAARPKTENSRAWKLTTEFGKPAIASCFFSGFPGFAWLAPAKDTINVGMGVSQEHSHELTKRFQRLLSDLGLEHELKNSKSYNIPCMPLKQIYSGRIMLVGDAAGMVDPWTGGGINWGFRSARAAAKAAHSILKQPHMGNNGRLELKLYQENMKNNLKLLRFKGTLLNLVIWCYNHKLTSPRWEQFMLKHAFPNV